MVNKATRIIVGIALIIFVGGSVIIHKQSKKAYYDVTYTPPATSTTTTPVEVKSTTTPTKAVTSTPKPVVQQPQQTQTQAPTPAPVQGITLAQVALHNSRESCWSVINGTVYDLTSWIPNHPGGERKILRICGIDGSDDYNGQHGNSKRTTAILVGFKLDVLAQ
jgi:cytochrome b involved in lipid metabolism